MNMKNKKTKVIAHGECYLFETELPVGAVKESINTDYVIIAPSEVTGNHHVIDVLDGVEFYTDGNKRFIKNSKPTTIRCLVADRHTSIVIEPGVRGIGIQQEYDYFLQAKRNVAD